MNWIKKHGVNLLLITAFLAGVVLLLYPTVSDYWNSFHQSKAIASYAEAVAEMDEDTYEQMLSEAYAYNEKLSASETIWTLNSEQLAEYNRTLNVSDTGIMGYIEIDRIRCSLPIYHGTDEAVLQIAVGHIEGSSLPVGGESTHAVLSGHRGLPSAKLFTNLDQLELGDTFVIRVLDETLTYEVDQILIVEPTDTTALGIEEGKDLCTLITCTPYGVNTHRLLVRGHRIENTAASAKVMVTSDAMQVDPVLVAAALAIPVLILLVIAVLIATSKVRKKRTEKTGR